MFMGVAGVKKLWCWIIYPLTEEGHAWFFSSTFGDHVVGPEKSISSTELAGDVESHAGVHVGLTIFSYTIYNSYGFFTTI